MIKRSEVAALLALAASLERSNWEPADVDVEAWHAIAIEGEWPSFEAARRALMVYRNEQPDFPVRPGHISQIIKRVHEGATKTFELPDIPREVEDDIREYQRWVAAQVKTHHDRAIEAFASGSASPPPKAIEA